MPSHLPGLPEWEHSRVDQARGTARSRRTAAHTGPSGLRSGTTNRTRHDAGIRRPGALSRAEAGPEANPLAAGGLSPDVRNKLPDARNKSRSSLDVFAIAWEGRDELAFLVLDARSYTDQRH